MYAIRTKGAVWLDCYLFVMIGIKYAALVKAMQHIFSQYWYFLLFVKTKLSENTTASASAAAVLIHIPSVPRIYGMRRTARTWKKSVREKEISADIRPLLSAVKSEDVKIEKPQKRKEIE